jgi:HAD superfamily hydrolase (TIGR01509 family)
MIQAVLFDFNGVLVDDEPQHCEALQRVLAEDGITLSRDDYYAHYLGLDDRTGFVEAYRRAQRTLTTDWVKQLIDKKSQIYLDLVSNTLKMVPGAQEFVRAAAQHFRLGIVSGALRREIESLLSRAQLMLQFEVIVAAGEVPQSKPHPASYLAALRAFNDRSPIKAANCVVIEDSLHGLQAARAAGMPCVMLTTSHAVEHFEGRGAAAVWASLAGHSPEDLAGL